MAPVSVQRDSNPIGSKDEFLVLVPRKWNTESEIAVAIAVHTHASCLDRYFRIGRRQLPFICLLPRCRRLGWYSRDYYFNSHESEIVEEKTCEDGYRRRNEARVFCDVPMVGSQSYRIPW